MKKYRLTVTYRRTRPYYPERHRRIKGNGELTDYYQKDVNSVGEIKTLVVGPYKTIGAVKSVYKQVKDSYPLANIYGDNELGYEIVDERWEEGVEVIRWWPVEA